MEVISSIFSKAWTSTSSAAVFSWNWYAGLPAWQQVGIAVIAVVVIGGTTYVILNSNDGGSSFTADSLSSGGSSSDTMGLDLGSSNVTHVLDSRVRNFIDIKSKIYEMLAPHSESLEVARETAEKLTPKLIHLNPAHLNYDMLTAAGLNEKIGSAISINQVLGETFHKTYDLPTSVSLQVDTHTVHGFADSIMSTLGPSSWVGDHVVRTSTKATGHLANLCAKPLGEFVKDSSVLNGHDVFRLQELCIQLHTQFRMPEFLDNLPVFLHKTRFCHAWVTYYGHLLSIPASAVCGLPPVM